jgi:DNA-binding response OmpR family regulator
MSISEMAPQLAPQPVPDAKRVVVVDDDRDICMLVQHRLTTMGMAVDVYFDGKSGLDAIVANPPDLAIIDVMMPGMDGLEVTRALRANEGTQNLPIVIFSALVRPADHEAGLAAGADHYVIKPFSVLALGAYVEKILGLRSCVVCGKRRAVDELAFSVEQMLQRTRLGWITTVDGDKCGECHVAALQKLEQW